MISKNYLILFIQLNFQLQLPVLLMLIPGD